MLEQRRILNINVPNGKDNRAEMFIHPNSTKRYGDLKEILRSGNDEKLSVYIKDLLGVKSIYSKKRFNKADVEMSSVGG